MKVLVTGFEPFGKFTINSSERAVSQFPKSLGGNEIVTAILPVSYSRSDKILFDVMRSVRPDAVVCVGQNASAPDIRVESTAGNYAHSEEEDSDHNLWLYRSIDMSGAPSYRSTLPIEEIVRNLKQAGIDAEVSHSAGTFVCNCLMYQALRACETEFTGVRCGFVHVPALPEQSAESGQPGMPLETIVKALEIAIGTVIDPESDGVLAADEPDDDDEFGNIAGVTPAMLAALNDDDDDAEETGAAETAQAADGAASVTETVATAVQETVTAAAVETAAAANATAANAPADAEPKNSSAAAAAVAYFAKTNRDKVIRDREQVSESEIYYGGPKKGTPSESKTGEVLKRISGSVPEKITTTSEAPRETLFEPPRERAIIDTKDYRVFSVDDKYRGAGDQMGQMTLTEFMDEFMPERQKTEQEIREEEKRTLIHEGDVRDPRTYQERKALREEAKRKEDAKEHIAFGDLYVMSETMRAMGKTLNKSVLVDDDIHQLLYTGVEDGGDICAYKIAELDSKGRVTARTIGELPTYAMAYEKYYVFRALTENKKIVCDPETYEISLEDI